MYIKKVLCTKLSKNKNFLKSMKERKKENSVICIVYNVGDISPKVWIFANSPYACVLLKNYIKSKKNKMIAFDINYYHNVMKEQNISI